MTVGFSFIHIYSRRCTESKDLLGGECGLDFPLLMADDIKEFGEEGIFLT